MMAITIIGNLILAGIFMRALLDPQGNLDFIYSSATLILLMEFLSIHSTGMIGAMKMNKLSGIEEKKRRLVLFLILPAIYALFVIVYGIVFQVFWVPAYFIASVFSKIFFDKSKPNLLSIKISIPILILTIFLVGVVGTEYINAHITMDITNSTGYESPVGFLSNSPQATVLWGVLYYGLCAVVFAIAAIIIKPTQKKLELNL